MAPVITEKFVEEHLRFSPYGPLLKPHEEDQRPWARKAAVVDKPLLRLWDEFSDGKPDQSNNLVSNRPQGHLHSFRARQTALSIQVSDHGAYGTPASPFIAFQGNPSELGFIAAYWNRSATDKYLTVINPNVRAANRLPTLNLLEEMKYYRASRPSARPSDAWYGEQYLCLWQVGWDEVVGTWMWNYLCDDENWYENIVYPAFLEHDRVARETREPERELESAKPCVRNRGTALSIEDLCQDLQCETNLEPVSHADESENATVARTSACGLGGEWDMPSESVSEVATEIDSEVD